MNARVLIVPLVVGIVALVLWKKTAPAVPAATWRLGTGTDIKQPQNCDDVPAETPLQLSFFCEDKRYVYVFSHSKEDGTLLMFPSPDVRGDLTNPLPTGTSILPGKHDDTELRWTTRSGILAMTTFVVVAAKEPIPELEALLPKVRRWTDSVLPGHAMLVTKPKAGEVAGAAGTPLPDALLQRAADRYLNETLINGPLQPDSVLDGVWLSSWRAHEVKADKPAASNPDGSPAGDAKPAPKPDGK